MFYTFPVLFVKVCPEVNLCPEKEYQVPPAPLQNINRCKKYEHSVMQK